MKLPWRQSQEWQSILWDLWTSATVLNLPEFLRRKHLRILPAFSAGLRLRKSSWLTQRYVLLLTLHALNLIPPVSSCFIKVYNNEGWLYKQKDPAVKQGLFWERMTGFEPATFSLGSWRSTVELRPQKFNAWNFNAVSAFPQAVGLKFQAQFFP